MSDVEDLGDVLDTALAELSTHDQEILRFRLGLDVGGTPRTLQETSTRFAVSQSAVRALEAELMAKARLRKSRG